MSDRDLPQKTPAYGTCVARAGALLLASLRLGPGRCLLGPARRAGAGWRGFGRCLVDFGGVRLGELFGKSPDLIHCWPEGEG